MLSANARLQYVAQMWHRLWFSVASVCRNTELSLAHLSLDYLLQYKRFVRNTKREHINGASLTRKLRIAAASSLLAVFAPIKLKHCCCSPISSPPSLAPTALDDDKRAGPRARRVYSQWVLPVEQSSLQLVLRGARPPVAVAQGRVGQDFAVVVLPGASCGRRPGDSSKNVTLCTSHIHESQMRTSFLSRL